MFMKPKQDSVFSYAVLTRYIPRGPSLLLVLEYKPLPIPPRAFRTPVGAFYKLSFLISHNRTILLIPNKANRLNTFFSQFF